MSVLRSVAADPGKCQEQLIRNQIFEGCLLAVLRHLLKALAGHLTCVFNSFPMFHQQFQNGGAAIVLWIAAGPLVDHGKPS